MSDQLPLTPSLSADDFEAMKNYRRTILVAGVVNGRVTWVPAVTTVHPRQQGALFPGDRLIHTDGSMWTVTAVDWDRSKGGRWSGGPTTYTLRQDDTDTVVQLTGEGMEDYWRPETA